MPQAGHEAATSARVGEREQYAVHGSPVELACSVPGLRAEVGRLLAPFALGHGGAWPPGFVPAVGFVRPYDGDQVARHVSPQARRVTTGPGSGHRSPELYAEGERFWLVDDGWGMSEINLLKGQWRSWVLPRPALDAAGCAEAAVLGPMSHLLRARGLTLLPAVAVTRGGWAALILSPIGLGPELAALVRAGYKVIGQRWTALREEDGRVAMLHMPGHVDRCDRPATRSRGCPAADEPAPLVAPPAANDLAYVDLGGQYPGSSQNHAFCDAVLVAEPGRRPRASLREAGGDEAAKLLRSAWPVPEPHPQRRAIALPTKLAQGCRTARVQLSRNPADLLSLIDVLRCSRPGAALAA